MSGYNHNNSLLRVCVDHVVSRTVSGRVYSRRLTKPVPFVDLSSLALRMEEVFDQQSFPQAFQRSRIFLREDNGETFAADDLTSGMSEELVNAQQGEVATFEVQVLSRRNSSWQGTVDWLDGSERQRFESFLELLNLINKRVAEDSI